MLFGESSEQLGLARDIVVHRNHDRRFYLVDQLNDIFETEIGHRIDGHHHNVDVLQHLHLLVGKQVANVAQVGQTQTAHLVDKYGIGDGAPASAALAGNIDDGNISYASADRVPGLLESDAA